MCDVAADERTVKELRELNDYLFAHLKAEIVPVEVVEYVQMKGGMFKGPRLRRPSTIFYMHRHDIGKELKK